MLITVANNLTVDNPSPELISWCKQNLVLPNPEYNKKVRMGFWTGNTPKTLSLYETRGSGLILPFGVLRTLPVEIKDQAVFINNFTNPVEVDFHAHVPLYDYQEKAVEAMIRAKYGILQSAAGSGKTQMGIALAAKLKRRTLWLCHTLDLVNQSRERAELYLDKSLMGTISEGRVNIGEAITFATVQTMCKLDLNQYTDLWDVIITDEVHRVSGSPTSVTRYQKVLNSLSARHKYGLSATVHRSDGMIEATYALVGNVVYRVPETEVAGKIMKVGIYPIGTGLETCRDVLNTDGTINYPRLISYLAGNEDRNKVILDTLVSNQQYSSLILSDRLEHLKTLMKNLPTDIQEKAVMISGKMVSKKAKAEREQAIEDMRTGKKKYLFASYSLAKEGLDVPCLERLYLTTPQKDYAVVTQSIGRIARTFPGKADPIAFDFVDNIGYLVRLYKKRCTTYRKNGCHFIEG